ncbi:hypothetical protein [Pseudonocardia oroxyli]|uniref:Uncharacterized protein n=1 Tax=Pseudonocardia oroxyli TaxID=366584 RepID=A0A1G8CRT1_PSEOR|nr:hypothetical protein [Pseudonocardia oroxyli]SDH48148.1 hypothetical protein SAMN05216377_12338 [Pseudonocardia oroxyli]
MTEIDILDALGLDDVDPARVRQLRIAFRRAWDVEIGRRCLGLLTDIEADELRALSDTRSARTWLDAHLPEHAELVRGAFEQVRAEFRAAHRTIQ